MHEYGSLPRARQDGLLEETVGEELLLYDRVSHTAHCLSPIAACVWRHCDGEHDLTDLAELAGASESLVADALHELYEKDLLDAEPQLTQSAIPGESRREVIGRVARYGAAAAAGSMIASATAATPAMAESEIAGTCCQCYTLPALQGKKCSCTSNPKYLTTDKACNNYCTSAEGIIGPVCSKNGSGVREPGKCGSADICM